MPLTTQRTRGETVRMSYGHADDLARGGAQRGEPEQTPQTAKANPPGGLPPDWYTAPDLKPVLAGHDVGALFAG